MTGSWRYRGTSVFGVAALTALAVGVVNNGSTLTLVSELPILGRLPTEPPAGPEFGIELLITVVVFVAVFVPLYKPRPRRILDTIALAQKRVLVAVFALATIGYFDYSYKLPRLTVLLVTPILLVVLPAWFVWIRRRPAPEDRRAIVVGDEPEAMEQVVREAKVPLIGYLCPTSTIEQRESVEPIAVADGGYTLLGLERLGGLSRIEDVLVEYDVDTAVLAFGEADRAEFFGALDACYEHGVAARVHQDHSDSVLTSGSDVGPLLDVDIEPWDIQDYVAKRIFDIVFSVLALMVLTPVVIVIALAIKFDDGGKVLYQQERTAVLGETFDVYKFRSMVENAELESGVVLSKEDAGSVDPRVTKIGGVLRKTHLDEVPQLWSVLKGDMSVVGPRPERPELDIDIQNGVSNWQKRWFVKPGLTGLSQINKVNGTNPARKIDYDLEYVRRQSFWFDTKMVIRQLWSVGEELLGTNKY